MESDDTPRFTVVYCRCGKVAHPSRRVATENLNNHKRHLKYNGRERFGNLVVYRCEADPSVFHIGGNDDQITKRMKANKRRPKHTGGDYAND